MKIKKTVHRSYDEEITDKIVCDICKETYVGTNWGTIGYEVAEVEVKIRTGYNYPDGGNLNEMEFDVCPKCFTEKLIPLLKEKFDAVPTENEWDT